MERSDLEKILRRKGYGIQSQLGGSELPKRAIQTQISDTGEVSDVELRVRPQPLPAQGLAVEYSGRCNISVKVFRKRLSDPLGDAHKWHIDSLRYCGLVRDDTDAEIRLTEEPHEKVATDAEERVEVTMEYEAIAFDPKYGKVDPNG